MGLFGGNYDRPGPGIAKNAPQKKGLALFFDIYLRVFWELIKLNLLFILFSLPIVTIGPAFSAMTRVMMLMVRERPFFVLGDFLEAFRQNWKQSALAGILSAVCGTALCVALVFYAISASEQPVYYALLLLTGVLLLIFGLALVYVFPMLVTFDFPFFVLVKNAFLLGLVCLKHSLPAMLLTLLAGVTIAVFFPYSVPVLVFFYFSHTAFIFCFAAWPGLEKYISNGQTTE